jgi:drug/metabolite transporter (DMT)-like permease
MTFLKKLASRKLWLAIAGVASGVAIALGASSSDLSTVTTAVSTMIGGLTALASIVTYIKTEGKIDAASIQKASASAQSIVEAAQTILDSVKGSDSDTTTDDSESEATNANAG